MLVDSHCHLDPYFRGEVPEILARARQAGVGRLVTIGVRLSQTPALLALAEAHPEVFCTVGIHPHNAGETPPPEVAEILALARHPKVIGIGESGLDYFYDKAPRDAQAESFRRHIRAARDSGLPLVVHARDADADIAAILAEERARGGEFPFLMHCFSSGPELARQAVAMGGYISFSGILTFPKSGELRALAAELPEDRLLLETDAPYLAPVPLRGKRNEPALVVHTARVLAEARGVTPERIAGITTANFFRLFRKAA
ncbi:MAG: TatD family hydrolase [Acetobacteraceae bacterium]|nr:TatD family hydrolase [Acetobacteraceae bacterium]